MIVHNIYKVVFNLHLNRFLYYKKTEQYYIFSFISLFFGEFRIVRGMPQKKIPTDDRSGQVVFLLKHHLSRLGGSPSADLTHCGSGRVSSDSVGSRNWTCGHLWVTVPIWLSVGTYFAVYQYGYLSVPISLCTNCTDALATYLRIVSKSNILTNNIRRRYAARRFSDVAISFVESRPAGNRSVVDRMGGERLFRRSAVSTGRRKAVPAVLRIRASSTDPHVAVRSFLATRAPSASQNNVVQHCQLSRDW